MARIWDCSVYGWRGRERLSGIGEQDSVLFSRRGKRDLKTPFGTPNNRSGVLGWCIRLGPRQSQAGELLRHRVGRKKENPILTLSVPMIFDEARVEVR